MCHSPRAQPGCAGIISRYSWAGGPMTGARLDAVLQSSPACATTSLPCPPKTKMYSGQTSIVSAGIAPPTPCTLCAESKYATFDIQQGKEARQFCAISNVTCVGCRIYTFAHTLNTHYNAPMGPRRIYGDGDHRLAPDIW